LIWHLAKLQEKNLEIKNIVDVSNSGKILVNNTSHYLKLKKIQDIYEAWLEKELDVRSSDRIDSPVISHTEADTMNDISQWNKTDISLYKTSQIVLEKKSWKHFDALERKWIFSQLFKSWDISLKSKSKLWITWYIWYIFSKSYISLSRLSLFTLIGLFIFCAWIYTLWVKFIIENRVNAWYEKLLSLTDGGNNINILQKNINNARFDLLLADILFVPFRLFWWEKIDSVWHVISWWRYLSKWIDDTLALYSHTSSFIERKDLKNIYFTQLLLNISPNLKSIEESLLASRLHYQSISWLPNSDLWEKKNLWEEWITKVSEYINILNTNLIEFLNIFGHDKRKRYLIVFQNADEIRPTWWFMWSMGLLEIFRWKVQLFQKKDVYAIEWDLKKAEYERLPAPKWISELTQTYGLRDSNYYVNLEDSSNDIKFFTDRAWIRLDWIIYINQNTLLRMLEKTGPMYFEPLEREITSENFSELMSLAVEAKTFKQWTLWTPKQVLFDFIQHFVAKLIEDGDYYEYAKVIMHDIDSRDIMFWSFNQEQNKILSEFWVNGQIDYSQSLDYLYPVYTSLSWNKSDRYMQRKYEIDVISREWSCDYDVNFQIRSTHAMSKNRRDDIQDFIQEYELDSPNLFEIQWAQRNRQYARVIIPKLSQVEEKQWTDVVDYGSRKWLEFFLETQLSETSIYEHSYTLENPKCENYSITIYKQPWIPEFWVTLTIDGDAYQYNSLQEDFYFEDRS